MKRCLFCYQPLAANENDFHPKCSGKIFGQPVPPVFPYSEADLEPLAKEVIQSQTSVTGVQTKISLHINSVEPNQAKRFTIVGLWGGYVLKPPTNSYPQLPEVEDLTMHLAQIVKIKTAPHSLIRMQTGNLAYITKRIDRIKKHKLAMEDMCQLTERLTEEKYNGSYEQIGKAILKYSATPGLDVVNFFELVLFSYITGNADMHLKNFSLLNQPGLGMTLSPAYDLVNTILVNPEDPEELALTLNAKKRKIRKQDFVNSMTNLQVKEKQQQNIFGKMQQAAPTWMDFIDRSFLTAEFKDRYKSIIGSRLEKLR